MRICSAVTTVTDAGACVISCENLDAVDVNSTSSNGSIERVSGSGGEPCARAVAGIRQARMATTDANRTWGERKRSMMHTPATTRTAQEECRG
jgi:hypothetical protein